MDYRNRPSSSTPASRPALPSVSVCLPVRNGAQHLGGQLAALASQDYPGAWEVIVADCRSTDGTLHVARSWLDRLTLRVVTVDGTPSASRARNVAAHHASGRFLAFCDHDDEVRADWISNLVAAASACDAVSGVIRSDRLNDPIVRAWKDDRATDRLVIAAHALPMMIGASCGMWADVFHHIGGWDEAVTYGTDDVDISWRVQFAGFTLGFAPEAVVDYRYRTTITALAKQSFQRSRMSAHIVARHAGRLPERTRPSADHRSPFAWLVLHFPRAVVDRRVRGRWAHTAARGAGWVFGRWEERRGRTPWSVTDTATETAPKPIGARRRVDGC